MSGHAVPAELVPGCFDPCPFCAAEPRLLEVLDESVRSHLWYFVYCSRCNAKGPPARQADDDVSAGHQAARGAWNRRGGSPW